MFYVDKAREAQLREAINTIRSIYSGVFADDMMITLIKNMSFLEDKAFMAAMNAEPRDDVEKSLTWRLHVLCWCAENALRLQGDFVECGVYRGFSTSIIANYLNFGSQSRHWYLYDTFSGIPNDQLNPGHSGSFNVERYQDPSLYDFVVQRFAAYSNIKVIRGRVPEVLSHESPQRIAFMHIDMNSAKAEIGALEALYDKMVSGSFLVLDDYGWLGFRSQKVAEDQFFAERGRKVLELPTGQGLVIK